MVVVKCAEANRGWAVCMLCESNGDGSTQQRGVGKRERDSWAVRRQEASMKIHIAMTQPKFSSQRHGAKVKNKRATMHTVSLDAKAPSLLFSDKTSNSHGIT